MNRYTSCVRRHVIIQVICRLSMCGTLFITAVSSVLGDQAIVTLDDLFQMAAARQQIIESVRTEYDVQWQILEDAPSLAEGVFDAYNIVFAIQGDNRYLQWRPSDPRQMETTAAFDGSASLTYSIGAATVVEGKDRRTVDYEVYCREFLQIAHSDKDIANREFLLLYPFCLRKVEQSLLDRIASQMNRMQSRTASDKASFQVGKSVYHLLPKLERVDGAVCHVLEYPGVDRIWVDPTLGGALRKRRRLRSQQGDQEVISYEYRCQDFKKVTGDLWLPMNCERIHYGTPRDPSAFTNTPILSMRVAVSSIAINQVSDDDFAITLPPGTTVISNSGSFVVPGDESVVLNKFADLGRKTFGDWQMKRMSIKRLLWVGVNAVVVLVLVLLVALRKWGKRSTPG